MGWHYACKKVKAEFGDGYEYTVVEVFPDLKKDTDGEGRDTRRIGSAMLPFLITALAY